MPPLIGISCSVDDEEKRLKLNSSYLQGIEEAGGVPVLLAGKEETARAVVARVDGVLLSGGVDVDPRYFGEEPHQALGEVSPARDAFELALAKEALRLGVPVFGICRGAQVMAVAGGGSLYQDLPSQRAQSMQHYQRGPRSWQSHAVSVVERTRLAAICGGQAELRVNSFHHQAVRSLPPGWVTAATAPDGVIEAFEDPGHPYWLAVQWHPEALYPQDSAARALFFAFVQFAQEVSSHAR
ncbi:MAG: gamma-glutamyl-gamma-aminobutyrate hydrolase family protein [Thermaerobacter sp.]|nr:gamma-glutamyl-gamma-aminobutyrate hydrolase family protein [Thermaerobacter sp.]